MRKFYSFLVAAVALVAFAACNTNVDDQIASVEGETMTLTADFAQSRTTLDGVKVKWDANDAIAVSNGTECAQFTIESLTEDGAKAIFKGQKLEGETLYAYYPYAATLKYENGAWVNATLVNEQPAVANSFANNVAVSTAVSNGETLSFENQCAVLKFQTPQMDQAVTSVELLNGEQTLAKVVGQMTAGNNYYAVVMPGTYTFTVKINDAVSKVGQKAVTVEKNTLYNLGTLEAPVLREVSTLWATAGTHNGWAASDPAPMYVVGNYVVAYNLAGGTQLKFVQVGKDWDGAVGGSYGEGDNPDESAANTWHNCGDVNILLPAAGTYDVYYLPTAKKYNVVAAGTTPEEYVAPKVALSLSGTFNNWGDTELVEQNGIYVTKSLKLDAYASFKVRKDKAWDESYGGGIVYMNPNNYILTHFNGSDISITEAGTYDVYFNYDSKYLYVVTAGTDYTTAPLQTVEGKEPVQEEPEVTEKVVYLKPNSNWMQSNARFAIYVWGGTVGEKWVSMTASDTNGIYQAHLPEGYDYGCNIIFCRMNPSTTANNWNNKWNQTSDLKTPTDGKNLYTVKDGTWDKGGGTWSVK